MSIPLQGHIATSNHVKTDKGYERPSTLQKLAAQEIADGQRRSGGPWFVDTLTFASLCCCTPAGLEKALAWLKERAAVTVYPPARRGRGAVNGYSVNPEVWTFIEPPKRKRVNPNSVRASKGKSNPNSVGILNPNSVGSLPYVPKYLHQVPSIPPLESNENTGTPRAKKSQGDIGKTQGKKAKPEGREILIDFLAGCGLHLGLTAARDVEASARKGYPDITVPEIVTLAAAVIRKYRLSRFDTPLAQLRVQVEAAAHKLYLSRPEPGRAGVMLQ